MFIVNLNLLPKPINEKIGGIEPLAPIISNGDDIGRSLNTRVELIQLYINFIKD